MDPLSVLGLLSGLAGIASAGASLSKALYKTASTIRGAPQEMQSVAEGVADLSVVLDQLRRVLKNGKRIHRRKLRKGIHGVLCRIEDIHFEIREMLSIDSRLKRLKWFFQKSRISYLLAKIESHKNTINLMMTTMLIAIEQRLEAHDERKESDNEKRRYRRQAENSVKTTLSSLARLDQPQSHMAKERIQLALRPPSRASMPQAREISQVNKSEEAEASTASGAAGLFDVDKKASLPSPNLTNQIQKWDDGDDTATWLYHLVFSDRDIFPKRFSQFLNRQVQMDMIRMESSGSSTDVNQQVSEGSWNDFITAASGIVDSLLYDWTELTLEEIEETRDATDRGLEDEWQLDLEEAVEAIRLNQITETCPTGNPSTGDAHPFDAIEVDFTRLEVGVDDNAVCPTCRQPRIAREPRDPVSDSDTSQAVHPGDGSGGVPKPRRFIPRQTKNMCNIDPAWIEALPIGPGDAGRPIVEDRKPRKPYRTYVESQSDSSDSENKNPSSQKRESFGQDEDWEPFAQSASKGRSDARSGLRVPPASPRYTSDGHYSTINADTNRQEEGYSTIQGNPLRQGQDESDSKRGRRQRGNEYIEYTSNYIERVKRKREQERGKA